MENIEFEVSMANVVPNDISPDLNTMGRAADSKLVGDEIRRLDTVKANTSDIPPETTVNGVSPDPQGNITLSASDIKLDDETSLQEAVEAVQTTASEAKETADNALQTSGGTMTGEFGLTADNDNICTLRAHPTASGNNLYTLPKNAGTLMLSSEAQKTILKTFTKTGNAGLAAGASALVQFGTVDMGEATSAIVACATCNRYYYNLYDAKINKGSDGEFTLQVRYGNPGTVDRSSNTCDITITVIGVNK